METVNENLLSKDTESVDNDLVLKMKKLSEKVEQHEVEKEKMREEFGHQRAKMKDLFLQKEVELKKESNEQSRLKSIIEKLEADLNETRTQLTVVTLQTENQLEEEKKRYQDEVASLQRLITETVDESSRNEEEVKRLKRTIEKLEAELDELRRSCSGPNESTGTSSSGTQLLTAPTAMISTFARKVVSQLGADSAQMPFSSQSSSMSSAENLEESMRKAQEDAEVLRSLVIPLEDQIKALKDKLRENDEKLRKYEQNSIIGNNSSSLSNINYARKISSEGDCAKPSDLSLSAMNFSNRPPSLNLLDSSPPYNDNPPIQDMLNSQSVICNSTIDKKKCETCSKYEIELDIAKDKCKELEKQMTNLERCKEELAKEVVIRKDMEQKWNEKKESHKTEVNELMEKMKILDKSFHEMKEIYKNMKTHLEGELKRLVDERRTIQVQLDRLQIENEDLIGRRNANARQLQDEVINLPDNVEELQEILLRCREDLISARVGQEAAEQQVATLMEAAQIQRFQTESETQTLQQTKNQLINKIENLNALLQTSETARHSAQLELQHLSNEEKSLRLEIEDLNHQLSTVNNAKKQLEDQISELKNSLSSLQSELHNSEIVQKDFVKLSQNLQQELERIRSSHTQVRWEHEDDVDHCPGCRLAFNVTRRKFHCKHCGRIFCVNCLAHTVLSGPNQRPSKVCDVCHTLLVQDTAPYFSTETPHSDD